MSRCVVSNEVHKSGVKVWILTSVDGELTGGQGTNHDQPGTDTSEGSLDTKLLTDLDEAGGVAFTRETLGLVDLAEHGVGRLGDDGGSETSDKTRAQVDNGLSTIGKSVLVDLAVDQFRDLLEDDEFGHSVWDPAIVNHAIPSKGG